MTEVHGVEHEIVMNPALKCSQKQQAPAHKPSVPFIPDFFDGVGRKCIPTLIYLDIYPTLASYSTAHTALRCFPLAHMNTIPLHVHNHISC